MKLRSLPKQSLVVSRILDWALKIAVQQQYTARLEIYIYLGTLRQFAVPGDLDMLTTTNFTNDPPGEVVMTLRQAAHLTKPSQLAARVKVVCCLQQSKNYILYFGEFLDSSLRCYIVIFSQIWCIFLLHNLQGIHNPLRTKALVSG